MTQILITGGAGFIGSNLVRYLNTNSPSIRVKVLDNLSTGRRENLLGSVHEFHQGTILDWTRLLEVAAGVDGIVHLAAIGSVPRSIAAPIPTHDANATGTLNIMEIARELSIPHVIVASSSSVYGSNPGLPKRELDWTRPMSPYAVSKLATEAYASAYSSSYGLKTLAFRFFNVYGPRQRADHDYAAVVPRFLKAALSGQPVVVFGDGSQSRDFTYVDSVCQAISLAIKEQTSSETPINLAFGGSTSLMDLIEILESILGQKFEIDFRASRPGDVKASQADSRLLKSTFAGLSPVALREGLESTVSWWKDHVGD